MFFFENHKKLIKLKQKAKTTLFGLVEKIQNYFYSICVYFFPKNITIKLISVNFV